MGHFLFAAVRSTVLAHNRATWPLEEAAVMGTENNNRFYFAIQYKPYYCLVYFVVYSGPGPKNGAHFGGPGPQKGPHFWGPVILNVFLFF